LFSEEIFNSIHQRDPNVDKDKNNNSTTATTSIKVKGKVLDKSPKTAYENNQKIVEKKPELSMTSTLKRKRDAKSPSGKIIVESPSSDATNRKLSSTTATILVSKTKTKTGLPLMLRKE
jgi:hypothetical protein